MSPIIIQWLKTMPYAQRLQLANKAIEWQKARTEKRKRLIRQAKARQEL